MPTWYGNSQRAYSIRVREGDLIESPLDYWRGCDVVDTPRRGREGVRRSQTTEAAAAAFILFRAWPLKEGLRWTRIQERDAPELYGCGVAMDINIRRKGSVVRRCCPSHETRSLLWGHLGGDWPVPWAADVTARALHRDLAARSSRTRTSRWFSLSRYFGAVLYGRFHCYERKKKKMLW